MSFLSSLNPFNSFGFGGSNTNTNYNQTNTQTPNLSNYWTGAYGSANGAVNVPGYQPGANQPQQAGIDYYNSVLKNPSGYISGPTWDAASHANDQNASGVTDYWHAADQLSGEFADVNQNGLAPIFNGATPQSGGTSSVNAQSGAQNSSPYSQLYGSQVTDPALRAFDYGTARGLTALDARTAGGGAFANSRSNIGYDDFLGKAALDRANLSSQLNTQGLTNSFGFGQSDANRGLSASTTNAGNTLSNNQFNASAQLQSNSQKLQAAQDWSDNVARRVGINSDTLAARLGMNQQTLQNTVGALMTRQGIDSDAAAHLVSTGAITQDQLNSLIQLAQASNGSTTDIKGSSNTNKFSFDAKI